MLGNAAGCRAARELHAGSASGTGCRTTYLSTQVPLTEQGIAGVNGAI